MKLRKVWEVLFAGRRLSRKAYFGIWLSICLITFNSMAAAVYAAIEQSAYRFSMNLDQADPTYITSNASSGDDTILDSVIDTANGTFFTVGHSTSNWLIEKRSELDGSLVSNFGTGGQIIEDVAGSSSEEAKALALDNSGGHIYVAGNDRVPASNDMQWRIEKRDMNSGNFVTAFGTNGVIQSNIVVGANKNDDTTTVVLDSVNGYVYIAGYDANSGNQWHIEKRRTSDGALCTAANCGTDFGTGGILTINPGGGDDRISAMEINPTNAYIFLAGESSSAGNKSWRVEKRSASNGNLCTAAECGTEFGSGGVFSSNPTSGDDQVTKFQVDSAGNAIYVGGYDNNNGKQWRVEKIDATTAAYITAFGTSGVVTSNPSAGDDRVMDLDLDGAGGYVYMIGTDDTGSNQGWRIEKRNRGDGTLVSSFANSGSLAIDPSSNNDPPAKIMIDIDRTFLWAIGGDRTLGTANMRWRFEKYDLDSGSYWLAASNTVGLASTDVTFRLRMLLHSTTNLLSSSGTQFKLQYAAKVGTCDTGFIGEDYADVSDTAGEMRYHNNPSISDAAAATTITGDPTHGSDTTVLQSIEELNNFTNPIDLSSGQDGLWDFVLKDSNAFGAYCFRAVNSDSSTLDTYTVIPEITFCKDDPKTGSVLRHGAYFCEGTERAFFWSRD